MKHLYIFIIILQLGFPGVLYAQYDKLPWSPDGNYFYDIDDSGIYEVNAKNPKSRKLFIAQAALTVQEQQTLRVSSITLSADNKKVLLFTNTKKVWRYETKGDYWVYDIRTKKIRQIGAKKTASSLMFAKFSPDAQKVAYVYQNNIYVEDIVTGKEVQLTTSGTTRLINGTFDWVYEEEFGCRDGFRWSPDGKNIAYWQLDATQIKNYLMINNTDSLYPFTIPVEYPVVGEDPSKCRIGVVSASGGETRWMQIDGDAKQHYIPRMEWVSNTEIILEQLNRRQNISRIFLAEVGNGTSKILHKEEETAWIDSKDRWSDDGPDGWDWINNGKEFIWVSEKGGWRQIYAIDLKGTERLITQEKFDILSIKKVDSRNNQIYFMASPLNATERYLYKIALDGNSNAVRLSPENQKGTHDYDISPNGLLAVHYFSSVNDYPMSETVSLPAHKSLIKQEKTKLPASAPKVEFFKVTTVDGVEMDGWMVKPKNFDPHKKYPVLFYVYGEPASQTVKNRYGTGINRLYDGDMSADGYIYISVDGRGTPAPKGRTWRKSIYKNIGIQNIRDQAMAAKEILKWNFIDKNRMAVWGWSGGGSTTLNLLFQYPDIYQTGISIAAVDNQLNYDNIYQERYMGLLPEDRQFFEQGSPIAHAKNLKGNLLLIHGTGDDNVHYNNAEQMINELIKYGKTFQMMSYPNRSHSISEGEGTSKHLTLTFTKFLKENCPPGAL